MDPNTTSACDFERIIADHGATSVYAVDQRGQGNANHEYRIALKADFKDPIKISFQNGPIKEVGVNGLTNEDLLAIVIDRLYGFQSGGFACRENAIALTKIEESYMWLLRRTASRRLRGVEGTNAK
jgi:hypothetical protein